MALWAESNADCRSGRLLMDCLRKGRLRAPSLVGKCEHSRAPIGSGAVAPPLRPRPAPLLCLPLASQAQVAAGLRCRRKAKNLRRELLPCAGYQRSRAPTILWFLRDLLLNNISSSLSYLFSEVAGMYFKMLHKIQKDVRQEKKSRDVFTFGETGSEFLTACLCSVQSRH